MKGNYLNERTILFGGCLAAILLLVFYLPKPKTIPDNERRIATLVTENKRLAEIAKSRTALSGSQFSELMRLRGEVAQFRSRQKDSARSQEATAGSLSSPTTGFTSWKPDGLRNAGGETPKAALETYLWSAMNTNLSELERSIVADENDPALPSDIAEFATNPVNHPQRDTVLEFKVLSEEIVSPTEVLLELHARFQTDGGMSGPVTLRNVGGEWKLVLFTVRDETGKFVQFKFGARPPSP